MAARHAEATRPISEETRAYRWTKALREKTKASKVYHPRALQTTTAMDPSCSMALGRAGNDVANTLPKNKAALGLVRFVSAPVRKADAGGDFLRVAGCPAARGAEVGRILHSRPLRGGLPIPGQDWIDTRPGRIRGGSIALVRMSLVSCKQYIDLLA